MNGSIVGVPGKRLRSLDTGRSRDALESAIVATLPAGNANFTAIVRGTGTLTGIAVVEVYALH